MICNEHPEDPHQKEGKGLNVMGLQVRVIRFLGLLPPESWWMYKIYVAVMSVCLFNYIPYLIMQLIAIYNHWGSIQMVTTIIFQIAACFNACVLATYFVYNGKQLILLFQMLETVFVPYIDKVGSVKCKSTIIENDKKLSKKITWVLVPTAYSILIPWICFPFIFWYTDTFGRTNVDEHSGEYWKHFCMIAWVPEGAILSPVYQIVYLHQALSTYLTVIHNVGCNMISFFLMFHTSTHFKLLASAIRDMSEIFPENITECEESETGTELDEKKMSQDFQRPINSTRMIHASNIGEYDTSLSGYVTYSEEVTNLHKTSINQARNSSDTVTSVEDNVQGVSSYSNYSVCHYNESAPANENSNALETPQKYEDSTDTLRNYFIACIVYHQEILRYCNIVENFLSPVLLVYFLVSEAMMCLSVYQIALGQTYNLFKFITSVANVCIWPLMICWCGDYLTEQSLSVQRAAYSSSWYNSSTEFKKLVHIFIMRTQKPVRFTAGKFYNISLETFGDISNKVYAYFTILKDMTGY